MEKLDSFLTDVKTVGIAGHVKPDGDCAGSCLAVYNYICRYYPQIETDLYLEPIPEVFRFLRNSDKIDSEFAKKIKYGLFIALDCADARRLGKAAPYFKDAVHTLCVDHHISNESFADTNYIRPDASSTCELVYGMMEPDRITREIAECIYVGLVHDTGVFQYSCTSAETMGIAGRLMESGIDFPKIVEETFYEKTYEQNRMLGAALLKSRLHLGGKVVSSTVTRREMEEFGVSPVHLDGIVSQLRVTKGVEAAIFLYESGPNAYKASMRSKGKIDVAAIASAFGGGGHVRAAGALMSGTGDEVLANLLNKMEQQLQQEAGAL